MTKPDKLYDRLRTPSGGGTVSFRDFEKLLRAFGLRMTAPLEAIANISTRRSLVLSRCSRWERTPSATSFAISLNWSTDMR